MEYILFGFCALIVIVLVAYISIYNTFKSLENKVFESLSGIDVALSKRFAAVSNCLEVCKGYCQHEKEVLELTVELRNKNIAQMNETNHNLDRVNKTIFALKENYPNLKADKNFLKLQDLIIDCEEHLQAARRFYNSNVALLNEKVVVFPSSIVANIHKIEKKPFFEAFNAEKEAVKVDYS